MDDVADVKPAPNPCAREIELHEVKMLNKHLVRLRDDFGLRVDVLLPHEVTGDDPPPRFFLSREGETYPLLDLRDLVPTVRKIGEKGIRITRFKGLGEMDAEQLWETTMDPGRRTLFQVRWMTLLPRIAYLLLLWGTTSNRVASSLRGTLSKSRISTSRPIRYSVMACSLRLAYHYWLM